MPTTTTMRLTAMVLGLVGAGIELYIGASVAFVGGTSTFKAVCVIILPIIIALGAVMIRVLSVADLGVGVIVIGAALQHNLIDIKSFALIPLGLFVLASALAFFVESQRQRLERPSTPA